MPSTDVCEVESIGYVCTSQINKKNKRNLLLIIYGCKKAKVTHISIKHDISIYISI